jgi:hypothetical protein
MPIPTPTINRASLVISGIMLQNPDCENPDCTQNASDKGSRLTLQSPASEM